MSNEQHTLQPVGRRLMGPGPSNVHSSVYEALSKPLVGHLDPQFLAIMNTTQAMLRQVMLTKNRLTLSVSGTGSSGMEAAFVNTVEPGDEVLVCVNGVFGNRMSDIVERIGGTLRRIDRPWGEVFRPQEVADALKKYPDVRVVAIVQAETSTGAHQPLREIGKLCRDQDRLFLVDAVTSLGGAELRLDDWNIDVCYSGTQKCLSCPPGLAPLSLGPRAEEKLKERKSKVVSWYLDLTMIQNYWTEGKRAYHHTAPISMNYALHQALALILDEGLEARWARHRLHSRALVTGLAALGFRLFPQEGFRLPMLNAVWIPEGVDDVGTRRTLLDRYKTEIGAGLGEVAGKIWRIGLMGESCSRENVTAFLTGLEEVLFEHGRLPEIGAGLEASSRLYADAMPPARRIPETVRAQIAERGEADFPEETCGFIFDRAGDLQVVPMTNIQNRLHSEDPETHKRDARTAYAFDALKMMQVLREHEEKGEALWGIYHSHPDHDAYFSATDSAAAAPFGEPSYPGVVHLVASVRAGKAVALKGFDWSSVEERYVEVGLLE